ncbi:glycosyltransferase family protein [Candidatus Coxiella mudrowiae]|uniref:Spore protein YkvP/CgeB glycosyl transferase-like domain-containing protein n=1 Tax=Candidatus Coxiella mudrowiae TaxID=2054173 RepID=A0ABM5UUT2_9COXI|nr:glycosyltransferase [Candidatus Coxiella mudrowiae]AKQ33745.1 hypothetical protein CleRT_10720 [Candidatus Coxiella mudrowiae]
MKIALVHVKFTYASKLSYLDDWLDAFISRPELEVDLINIATEDSVLVRQIQDKIEKVPYIIVHHSVFGDSLQYIQRYVQAFKYRRGKMLCFVGNEVNLPILGMKPKLTLLKQIKPQIIATQLLQAAGEWLYADCTSTVLSIPHALNPKVFSAKKTYEKRLVDVGTRSHRYSPHLGDDERNRLLEYFANTVPNKFHLRCNVDTSTRFNREGWAAFLNQCKATIATEVGSFYLQKDDALVDEINYFFLKNSKKPILEERSFLRAMARGLLPKFIKNKIKQYLIIPEDLEKNADFKVIYHQIIKKHLPCPEYSKTISSRHFDAIGTKTLQILTPGRYADILKPYEHYFPLTKNFSNIEEIIDSLKDKAIYTRVTEAAYEHVISNHTYQHRIDQVIEALG